MQRFVKCRTRRLARRSCPWATIILKVEGGFLCFEHIDGYLNYQLWQLRQGK
jgi:hypothetical protein